MASFKALEIISFTFQTCYNLKELNTRNTYSAFTMTFFVLFLHYIDFHMKIPCKKQHCILTNKRNVYYIVFQAAD